VDLRNYVNTSGIFPGLDHDEVNLLSECRCNATSGAETYHMLDAGEIRGALAE